MLRKSPVSTHTFWKTGCCNQPARDMFGRGKRGNDAAAPRASSASSSPSIEELRAQLAASEAARQAEARRADEQARRADDAEAARLAAEAQLQRRTARELMQGKAMLPAQFRYAWDTKWDETSRPSKKAKESTKVGHHWIPTNPKENFVKWSCAEFVKMLREADVQPTIKVNGTDTPLLRVVLDSMPSHLTASKLKGLWSAGFDILNSEDEVESVLLELLWIALKDLMSETSSVQGFVDFTVRRGEAILNKDSPQYVTGFKVDDTVAMRVRNEPGALTKCEAVATIEVKLTESFPHAQFSRADCLQFNPILRGHLVDYVQSGLACVNVHDPLKQLAGYLLLLRRRFGVITTLNETCFTLLQLSGDEEWKMLVTERFDVRNARPLGDAADWSLWEIWLRFILVSSAQPHNDKVPTKIREHFRLVGVSAEAMEASTLGAVITASGPAAASSSAAGATGGSALGAKQQAFVMSWADLWDPRRFPDATMHVPPEVEFSADKLDGDAEVIAEGRVGRTYRKTIRGEDAVVKVLLRYGERADLDGDERVYPEKIVGELRREEQAYRRLEALQGVVVPTFLCRLYVLGGSVVLFATRYAGESLDGDAPLSADVKAQMRACLEALHAHGVAHGDVAVKNFVQDKDGRVCVLDFGFSEFKDEVSAEVWETLVAADLQALEEELKQREALVQSSASVEDSGPAVKLVEHRAMKRSFEEVNR